MCMLQIYRDYSTINISILIMCMLQIYRDYSTISIFHFDNEYAHVLHTEVPEVPVFNFALESITDRKALPS